MAERLRLSEAVVIAPFSAGSGALGALLGFGGQMIASSRAQDAKMVEIAMGILRADPKPEIIGARTWAVRVINKSSAEKLNKDEKESVIKNAVPYVPSLDFSDPRNSQYLPSH